MSIFRNSTETPKIENKNQRNKPASIGFSKIKDKKTGRITNFRSRSEVPKNSAYQINYGTGNEVSDESIADAKEPLKVKWRNDSFIKIPIWKD